MRCTKTTNSTNPESGQGHTWGRLKKGLDSLKHERQERVTGQARNVKHMTTKCYCVLLDGTPAQKRQRHYRDGWPGLACGLDGCSPAPQPGSPPEHRARAVQEHIFVVGKDTTHHICSLFSEGSEKDQCDGYIYTEGKKKWTSEQMGWSVNN